ncbi:hypothetical protein [Nakamurella leprariae]|uniref:VWA domain-containing protein n=1 Tax=Nakamurella leprariae TaxID=2803911 RepID=A0A938Y768_9ACTN|nr:hypothetical protein [Nakamurella leprariae]MBM9467070.1 hypothetical protein [Nakamurella leprariae]
MGYGRWNDDTFRAAATFRRAAGRDDFGWDADVRRRPRSTWAAAPELDPFRVDARESRDSAEHPASTPVAVLFDVTGSMGRVPRLVQQRLADLHGLLRDQPHVPDPQILFGAIGDAETDRVPLQVGQFESDNRMDEQLRSVFLEGGGGGQKTESYELAAYFIARHTVTDAWERHGRKGYLFLVGDEMNKPWLRAEHVRRVIGDRLPGDLDTREIYREVQQRWHTFFVLPRMTAYWDDPQVDRHWRALLGERLLRLEDPAAISDLIAATIATTEAGAPVDGLDDGLAGAGVAPPAGAAVVLRRPRALRSAWGGFGFQAMHGRGGR